MDKMGKLTKATMMGHICLHVYFQKRQLTGYNNLTYVKIAAQGLKLKA
jgi:hypothetical protein